MTILLNQPPPTQVPPRRPPPPLTASVWAATHPPVAARIRNGGAPEPVSTDQPEISPREASHQILLQHSYERIASLQTSHRALSELYRASSGLSADQAGALLTATSLINAAIKDEQAALIPLEQLGATA